MEKVYFNPTRVNHLKLLEFLEEDLKNQSKVSMCKFGHLTQHLFVKGNYYMTIDWTKV